MQNLIIIGFVFESPFCEGDPKLSLERQESWTPERGVSVSPTTVSKLQTYQAGSSAN